MARESGAITVQELLTQSGWLRALAIRLAGDPERLPAFADATVPGGVGAETDDEGAYELCIERSWPGSNVQPKGPAASPFGVVTSIADHPAGTHVTVVVSRVGKTVTAGLVLAEGAAPVP